MEPLSVASIANRLGKLGVPLNSADESRLSLEVERAVGAANRAAMAARGDGVNHPPPAVTVDTFCDIVGIPVTCDHKERTGW